MKFNWVSEGTLALRKRALIGIVNVREITATVYLDSSVERGKVGASVRYDDRVDYKLFNTVRSAKKWASTEFNRIVNRF